MMSKHPIITASSALFEGGTPLGVLAHDDARAPGRTHFGACDVLRAPLPGIQGPFADHGATTKPASGSRRTKYSSSYPSEIAGSSSRPAVPSTPRSGILASPVRPALRTRASLTLDEK